MGDLVTHLAVVLIPAGLWIRRWRVAALMGVGSVLPDVVSRVPGEGLNQLRFAGAPVPDWSLMPWGVLHEPLCLCLVVTLVSLGFREQDRWIAWRALAVGAITHTLVDTMQYHYGAGYRLLFPLSFQQYELGWVGSEATVPLAPWLALVTVAIWGVRVARQRSRGHTGTA